MQFNVAAETYAVPSMADVDRPGATYAIALSGTTYQAEIVSANFNSAITVQFNVFGRPDQSGSVVVRSGTVQKTVSVDALGNVQVL